jgi:putative N6-adenine-specific DNA methylase
MMTLVAPCAIGAEKVLTNELKQLGFVPETIATGKAPVGRVAFAPSPQEAALGDAGFLAAAYRANLTLRTADRVYARLAQFPAADFEALFEGVKRVRWQDWFRKDVRVVVDKVRTHASKLSSEHSVQGVTHKAIYETLGAAWRMSNLPETGDEATVRVYVEQNEVSVLLDLSGMPLHRRGYRTAGGEAPIRETLAAVLLQLMSWRRKTPLHDAFCGSGTIPIEATLYAHNIAPGLGRAFALETLVPFVGDAPRAMMAAERIKAAQAIRTDCLVRVTGSDIDPKVLLSARGNAERACAIAGKALQDAGIDARITRPDFTEASFADLTAPYDSGLLISNPPWGERLEDKESARALYSSMHRLFTEFPAWEFGFITSHTEFEQAIGKKADKKRKLKSGNLDTCFYMYEKGAQ